MSVFDIALATLHDDPNLGVVVQFRRPPYAWQPVRVILSQPTDMIGTARAGTLQAEIRAAAVSESPRRGDELRIDATVYTVEDAERDALGLSWRLTLSALMP